MHFQAIAVPVLDSESILEELHSEGISVPNASIFVAYSGGVDSTVLLHAVHRICKSTNGCLTALHVNHGIVSESEHWEAHCKQFCKTLDIDFRSTQLQLSKKLTRVNENHARNSRYSWLANQTSKHDVLLTAHHQDDQTETLLLNLMRGAGVRGLAGMQKVRTLGHCYLVRPLLGYSKSEILEYAKFHRLDYVEDDSNSDLSIRRNFLRHVILPSLTNQWPAANQSINRTANILSDVRELLDQLAEMDLTACRMPGTGFYAAGAQFYVKKVRKLPATRQINLIRFWIRNQSFPEPNQKVIEQILKELVHKDVKFGCVEWLNYGVYLYQNLLYLSRLPKVENRLEPIKWNLKDELSIPSIGMKLSVQDSPESGICYAKLDGKISIRFRQGGERIRLPNRAHSSRLKKLFQEHRIPPWERSLLPLIYCDEEIVAVAPWLVAGKYLSEKNQAGIRIVVEPNYQPS